MKMTKKANTFAATLVLLITAVSAPAQRRDVPVDNSDRPKIDVQSYDINVTLMPKEHQLNATVEVKFRQLERASYAAFDLDSRFHLDKVTLDGQDARHRQYDLDSTVEVQTTGQFADVITARFEYKGFIDTSGDKRAAVLASITEDGAFLLYETKWFPLNDLYKDKATVSLKVTAPPEWKVLSDIPASGSTFSSTTPSYWGLLVAGNYTTTTQKLDRGDLSIHTLKAKSDDAKALVERASKALNYYTDTFGPPTQANFHIIEAAGANWPSRWGVGALLLPSTQFRPDFDAPALARALAHQWFPLKFSIENPARDAWLGDGFATFASLMFAEKTLSPAESQEQIDKALVKALASKNPISVTEAGKLDRESADYRSLVEYKGAYVLRMLQWVIGEDKFHDFLVKYTERFQATPASTDAVKKLAADVAGQDLNYFFEQWLVDSGVPEMTAESQTFRVRNGYRVDGVIKQDLDLFRMPVELEITTDGEPEYRRVDVARQSSDFSVTTERKPKDISIDPRKKILRLSADIRVDVAINRGEELMNEGRNNEAQDEFQEAIDLNPKSSLAAFKMGEALFEIGNVTQASSNFRNALTGDLKPKWVEVWSYINLGKIYDSRGDHERAVVEYQKAISTGDDSFGAQADAQKYITTPWRASGQR
jgi:aminopeptidase N